MNKNEPSTTFGASRMNARAVLKAKIERERKQTKALEILHDELDWENLTSTQEEVLWSYFISR